MATTKQKADRWTAKTQSSSPSTKNRKAGPMGVYGDSLQFKTVLKKFSKKG